jgi:predicted acylesterase/phospholipase RssA
LSLIPIEALILKGGGVKGLAFAGAVRELQAVYDFQGFVGTSAGAIAAALLAAGASGSQLEEKLRQKPFREFLDGKLWRAPYDVLAYGGIHPGYAIANWIRDQLFELLLRSDEVKMKDLPKRAVIYASQRDRSPVTFDTIGEHSDSTVHAAVRYSLSIPFFFQRPRMDEQWIYDGGLLANFPVEIFLEQEIRRRPQKPLDFIALYLGSRRPRPMKRGGLLSDIFSISIERNDREVIQRWRPKTIVIDTDPIETIDFDLSEVEKNFLILVGRAAALEFLHDRGHLDARNAERAISVRAEAEGLRRRIIAERVAARHSPWRRYVAKALAGIAAVFAILAAAISIESLIELSPPPDPLHSLEALAAFLGR